jgi:hypothetical protein
MNRIQKLAWLNIGCLTISVIVVVILCLAGFSAALLLLVFGCICGIGGLLVASTFKKDSGLAQFDERDRVIELKAMRISFVFSFLAFIVVCMGLWAHYHLQGIEVISIDVLTIIVWPPAIILFSSHALTILILYGKDNKNIEGGAA